MKVVLKVLFDVISHLLNQMNVVPKLTCYANNIMLYFAKIYFILVRKNKRTGTHK